METVFSPWATLVNTLAILVVMTFVAFLIETLVEFALGVVFNKVPKLEPYKWTLQYVAIGLALWAVFTYQFDVVYRLGIFLGAPGIPMTTFGLVISAIAIGKGSNYLHDAFQKFFVKKPESAADLPG